MARVLITGIAGFAGSHLAEALLATTDDEIWGIVHRSEWRLAPWRDDLHLLYGDLTNPYETAKMIETARPDRIYHLAGQAHVGQSWSDPWVTYEVNIRSQLNIIESALKLQIRPRTLIVTSNLVYGKPKQLPIAETAPLQPDNPYGISKAAQDLMGGAYFSGKNWPIIRARPFNHIGPRQADTFVVPAFAKQVANIENGLQEPVIHVGNLSARRDFSDVRDVVHAYQLLMEHGTPGEVYNVGQGKSYAIQTILDILLAASRVAIRVVVDPDRFRPNDTPDSYCDNRKIKEATGWEPAIPWSESVLAVLAEWRERIRLNR